MTAFRHGVCAGLTRTSMRWPLGKRASTFSCAAARSYPRVPLLSDAIRHCRLPHIVPLEGRARAARQFFPETSENGYVSSAVADYAGDIFSRMSCFDRVRAPSFNFTTLIRQRGLEIHFFLLPFLQNSAGRFLFPEARAFAQNSAPAFIVGDIKSEIDALARKKRFFLSVFFSATHFPYASPTHIINDSPTPLIAASTGILRSTTRSASPWSTRDDRRQIEACSTARARRSTTPSAR